MKCFVIMPFSKTTEERTEEHWNRHFEEFLKPTIEEIKGVKVYRSEPLRGDILKGIIKDLIDSHIVVADLTDSSPNVYWELGVRQSFKHGTVTIAQEKTILPFDINKKGTLFYKPSHTGNKPFITKFKAALKDAIDNPEQTDSAVLETISGRGSLYEIITREENLRRLEALSDEVIYNKTVFESITTAAINNTNMITAVQIYLALRFRILGLEWLLINRHIDPKFINYFELGSFFNWLLAYNSQLNNWPSNQHSVNTWLTIKDSIEVMEIFFIDIPNDINRAINKLENQR